MVLTLTIRLAGVDGPWLRQKLGIVVLIKTGPAAKVLSWQQHNGCHFVSFVMIFSGAKFEEHCFNISSLDIFYSIFYHFRFLIQCFTILVANLVTSSVW